MSEKGEEATSKDEPASETIIQSVSIEVNDDGQQESIWMSMGIHGKRDMAELRKRRLSRTVQSLDVEDELSQLAPNTRVMFLLDSNEETRSLFTEMIELSRNGSVEEWKETARWVKFEEDVEEGGNRWSKPHVATLSLHALFQLRNCLLSGTVIIDDPSTNFQELTENVLEKMIQQRQLPPELKLDAKQILMKRHTHQYEQARSTADGAPRGQSSTFLNAVRSISDIGRNFSHGRGLSKAVSDETRNRGETSLSIPGDGKNGGQWGNMHFMKKLPPGTEGCSVLVGEVDFLQHHVSAFVRLAKECNMGDLTEVPVPTRFVFILLGPLGHGAQFKEIGRAISTLMTDEIFHDVAYKAKNREHLLDGVDEFLDQVTCLPPGEWDPKIRIEPPNKIPDQTIRIKTIDHSKKEECEDEGHANDPALQRTGKLCGGLIMDIKRKAQFYVSDFTDALNLQSVATICFMYFALLAPIVTFGGLLEEATHQRMAAMENIFSGALCGVIYHLFSGQPLTIIGSTGPVLVFETIVFDLCKSLDFDYLSFRFWVHVWTALILLFMVVTDASSLVSYITRFTEESFATLIAAIFIFEAVHKLLNIRHSLDVISYNPLTGTGGSCVCSDSGAPYQKIAMKAAKVRLEQYINKTTETVKWDIIPMDKCSILGGIAEGPNCYILYDKFLMSLVLMAGTFIIATNLKGCKTAQYFPSKFRQILSDFAVMIAIIVMTFIDIFVGINTPKLNVPDTFRPTWEGRGWFIPPFNGNPYYSAAIAFFPALLACILIFMDQQISAVIVNRKENKLKKGCGYHLDLFVLSLLIIIVGALGLPIYVAATVLSINHVNSLRIESESRAPGEVAQFIGVREQRLTGAVTFILIGLSVLATGVLSHIPMPVLYGVFLYMGISALNGIQLFERLKLILMPMKYQPDAIYIRHVPILQIHKFTICQILCLIILWVIKSVKETAITFPIMLVLMVAVRKLMEKIFDEKDLKYLDDKMPDFHLRKNEDRRRKSLHEEIELDLDQNQGTLRAVKTEGHLHIPLTTGNVIKIPLNEIPEPSHNINISKAVNSTGMWKHILHESRNSVSKMEQQYGLRSDSPNHFPKCEEDDDTDAITIKISKPSPTPPTFPNQESQPLLRKGSKDGSSNNSSPTK
uniref:Anion exchange protein n=1 Tax=Rhabditophanes sp. KR3021 TaxID=114890 RepID=A0AC35U0J7_9BILA